MSYLKFDKVQLTNLEKSLDKEILQTNGAGAYGSTTVIDCNTRKYHGLLVAPIPALGDENFVLLSSCDETVIQHGAEFNLGLHKFAGNHYSPRGHKYIREFHVDSVVRTVYRVGGVILQKERVLVTGQNRVLICYTLLESNSPTILRLRPMLAFRSVNSLTHQNSSANLEYRPIDHGVSFCMYPGYPNLNMQLNISNTFIYAPDWYRNVEYSKEQERGYDFQEDVFVPGYFEVPLQKGERLVFSAGTDEIGSRKLLRLFETEKKERLARTDFKQTLCRAAEQFYTRMPDGLYLMTGFPWFHYRARDFFVALPGCTLSTGQIDKFYQMMQTGQRALVEFMEGQLSTTQLTEIEAPDVLLWYVWTVQQYALSQGVASAAEKFGDMVMLVVDFIRKQRHQNLYLHSNHLLYTNGTEHPATWMNATENDVPINPRTGYVVEINALWYDVLQFAAQLQRELQQENMADTLDAMADATGQAFVSMFWNGVYLYDYVVDGYCDNEVRPNMLLAAALPFTPLNRNQQKSMLDLVTRELLTVKGLRSLSPKSGMYRPVYVGGILERNRNYHNGPVWPFTTGFYVECYLKVYGRSGLGMVKRLLAGFESELTQLTIGTLSELFDGNPPYRGHGAMSFAMSVAAVLRSLNVVEHYEAELDAADHAVAPTEKKEK